MDCRQCNDDMTAYIDGELDKATAEQMGVHLDRCPPCRDEYRGLKNSAAFVTAHVREIDPTPELWNNLRIRIAEMPPPSSSTGFFHFLVVNRWTAAIATLAATVVLAVGIWSYVQRQNAQSDLEASFREYIETRTVAEQIHSQRLLDAENAPFSEESIGPKSLDNPFADIRPVSLVNPFRSEQR